MKKSQDKPADAAELRRRAEKRLKESKKEEVRPGTKGELQRLLHELQVHQIELEMQNEELLKARAEVEAGLERYTDLYDFAPVGYLMLDHDGTIRQVNLTGARLLGVERSQLVNRRFGLFVSEEDRPAFNAFLKKVFESQAKESCEVALLKEGNHPFYVHIEAVVTKDGQECHAAVADIAERKRAEEALKESEKRYRQVVENAAEIIYSIDLKGNFTYGNPAGLEVTGFSLEELRKLNYADLVAPEHRERVAEIYTNQLRQRIPTTHVEFPFFNKTGGITWFSQNTSLIIEDGRVVGFHIIARDITERKKAEEALKKSEEKYRVLVENANEAIFVIQDGMLRFFNIKNIELIGYSKEELTSTPFINFVHPDDREATLRRHLKRIRGEELPGVNVFRVIDKAGNIKWAEVNSVLISWEGRPAILNFLNDITERKRAEEALRESEERYRTILETIEEGYFEVDITGNFTLFNDSLCRMLGYTKDELMGMNNRQYMDKETAKKVYQVFNQLYTTGEPYKAFDWEIIRKDGTKRFHDSSVSLIRNEKGEGIGFRGIARDITERKKAEEALRLQSAALEAAANAIVITDLEGMIEWANSAFTALTGYSFAEVVRKNPREIIKSGEQNQAFYKDLWDTILAGKVWRGQIINRRKDGSLYTEEMTITPLRNERGKISHFIAIKQDITDRKLAEDALRASEGKYRTLIENVPQKIFLKDKSSVYISCNKSYAQDLKIKPDEISGKTDYEFYPKELAEQFRADDKRTVEKGKTEEFEEKYIQNGQEVWVNTIKTPVKDEKGNLIGILGIFWDITERKRAEENLKQSEENARQLAQENAMMAEIGRIISSTLDIDEIYESFSEEVRRIIPFDRVVINIIDTEKNTVRNVHMSGKKLQDRNVKDIYPLEGSGNAEMVRTKSTLLIQTEDFSEYKNRFPMLMSTFQAGFRSIMNVPLFSKGKVIGGLLLRSYKPYAYTEKDVKLAERIASQIAGAVANAQLYAERIIAEKEKETLQEQLRQSQKMEAIGRLAGGIAHDFNNLLTIIKGYSQLSLLELKESDPVRENIEEVRKASDRASDLIRQLLAFSRRQILDMTVLDLTMVMGDLDKMLRRVIGEDIELVTLLAEDLGRVKTDPGQIQQVIMNLAVNARDAMPNGGKLTIETANVELDEAYARAHIAVTPGRYVMLSVSDTGVGMSAEVRDQVFDPFFTTKEKGKGTGLGLSTVYGIVKQSGGNIWVYSEPGRGSTLKIYLPRVDEPLQQLREEVVEKEIPRGNETILVVEDTEEVLKLAARILEKQGYTVLQSRQGKEALSIFEQRKEPIHLILTDVVMPQMSGRQLIEKCRMMRQDFNVLYMSGYTDNAIAHHGILEEGIDYIQKPFTVEGLARKVREVLDK